MAFSKFHKENRFVKTYGQTIIGHNTDLNTITKCGSYSATSNALAQTLTNCPVTMAFTMNVYNATGNEVETPVVGSWTYFYQEIIPLNKPYEKYYRSFQTSANNTDVYFDSSWVKTAYVTV